MNNDTHPSEQASIMPATQRPRRQQLQRTQSVAAALKALSRARSTLATLGIGLVLGACGQKGPLVRPHPSDLKPAAEAAAAPSPVASAARP